MGNRQQHRNFAIRLWGQGIASLMYRFWYHILAIFADYQVNSFQDFHRPVSKIAATLNYGFLPFA